MIDLPALMASLHISPDTLEDPVDGHSSNLIKQHHHLATAMLRTASQLVLVPAKVGGTPCVGICIHTNNADDSDDGIIEYVPLAILCDGNIALTAVQGAKVMTIDFIRTEE